MNRSLGLGWVSPTDVAPWRLNGDHCSSPCLSSQILSFRQKRVGHHARACYRAGMCCGLRDLIDKKQWPWADCMKSKCCYYIFNLDKLPLLQVTTASVSKHGEGIGDCIWSIHLPSTQQILITSLLCTSPGAGGWCARGSRRNRSLTVGSHFELGFRGFRWGPAYGDISHLPYCEEGFRGAEACRRLETPRRGRVLLNQRIFQRRWAHIQVTNTLRQSNIRENK